MLRGTDYIHQLADYIKKNLAKGYTIDALKFALLNQEYSRSEVTRAINLANEQLANQAPKMQEKPKIKVERIPVEPVEEEKKKSFFKRLFK